MAELYAKSTKQYLLHACIFVYVRIVTLEGTNNICSDMRQAHLNKGERNI